MICAWQNPPVCRDCNESAFLCECQRWPRRQPRYYDEQENLIGLFWERPLRWTAVRAHEREANARARAECFRRSRYSCGVTERLALGFRRPDREERSIADRIGDRALASEVGLAPEAVYALHFRDPMHPEDLDALAAYWSKRMAPVEHWSRCHLEAAE